MTPEERRIKYKQYLQALKDSGGVTDESILKLLNDSINVTESDINSLVDAIAADDNIDTQAMRFMLLGEDLRDYRDSAQIKANRSAILRDALDISEDEYNERYMFLG